MAEAAVNLLLGGNSLRGISGLYVAKWDALLPLKGPYRGSNFVIPGTNGQTSYVKYRDAYVMDFPVSLLASTKWGQLAILAAIETAVGADNLLTLSRVVPTDSSGATSTLTCAGEYLPGAAFDSINWVTGRTTLSFVNLDGAWA
jgi:hypothetical protein